MECLSKYFRVSGCYPCNSEGTKRSPEQENFVQNEIQTKLTENCKPKGLKQSSKEDAFSKQVKSQVRESTSSKLVAVDLMLPDETDFSNCGHRSFMHHSVTNVLRGNVFPDIKSDILYGESSGLSPSFVETLSELVLNVKKGSVNELMLNGRKDSFKVPKQSGDQDGLYEAQDLCVEE